MIKEFIVRRLIDIIEERIAETRFSIETAKESRDNETKSSVGDKYETGRTLMQQEVEKNRAFLNQNIRLLQEIQKINPNQHHDHVTFGSLVKTETANYFIATALGKIEIDGQFCFCISLASPIGKMLSGKKVNETFKFNNKTQTILEIQ